MNFQNHFDRLIKLLQIKEPNNPIVEELLAHCLKAEIAYSTFASNTEKVDQSNLLKIYELRAKMENDRKENPFVFGYKELLPTLRLTPHKFVCISSITSDLGSFIIFTDYKLTDFIGILKSKRTLSEIRKTYADHKLEVEKSGEKVIYNYEDDEVIFINGKLQL